ncbi:MAG TPA: M23 family metallopeptidase [Labilithrix sp.]|jgi:murein DD-endopeptidase MepM/ murein hydrolase activator NlpD
MSVPPDKGRTLAFGGMGALVLLGLALIIRGPQKAPEAPAGALAIPTPAPSSASLESAVVAAEKDAGGASVDAGPRTIVPAWRAASLKSDPSVEIFEGAYGKHSLATVLEDAKVAKGEMKRLVHAFDNVHRIEHPPNKDQYVLAKDKAKGTILAFEHIASPSEVWQARADDDAKLVAKKLDLFVEHRRFSASLVLTSDLAKAIAAAGLREETAHAIDDALDAHVEIASLKPGTRMRLVGDEQWIDGAFARVHVDAIEVTPAGGQAMRVYYFEHRAGRGAYWNGKAQQPFEGAWRSPIPAARITSRFNPNRMHPVLHVIRPHNGVDFGASTGTPVYASAAGVVASAGNAGPCGNMVEIDHGGGLTTNYCHLSRFAAGLHAGQHVEGRQLVGYVGATGRVTGPHLHFGVKKNGQFVDPLALKMDAVRVVPPSDRDAFQARRRDLDAELDAVALPAAPEATNTPDDDKDEPTGEE